MAATQSNTASKRHAQAIERARSRVEDHDFGVITAEELQSRLKVGDSNSTDVMAMLVDVQAILNCERGKDALVGFTETVLKIASRNTNRRQS